MECDKVWVGDPKAGFVLGNIVEIGDEGPIVQPHDRSLGARMTSYDMLYPAEDDDRKEVDDNCSLMYLNEATLLHNVKLRYHTFLYIYIHELHNNNSQICKRQDLYICGQHSDCCQPIQGYQGSVHQCCNQII